MVNYVIRGDRMGRSVEDIEKDMFELSSDDRDLLIRKLITAMDEDAGNDSDVQSGTHTEVIPWSRTLFLILMKDERDSLPLLLRTLKFLKHIT